MDKYRTTRPSNKGRKSLKMLRASAALVIALLTAGLPLLSNALNQRPAITAVPRIPGASRANPNRVFLEKADRLHKTEFDSFMVVSGNVHFRKGPMNMYCDSAHYFPATESFDAYGNVKMEQGDTLFVYGDELNYDGPQQIAFLYADAGRKVRLINRDVTLESDVFAYDLAIELGYYDTGGKLYDSQNVLTSIEGEYMPSTKEANFYHNVKLHSTSKNDTLEIYTDTLYYNTGSHIAELNTPSVVVNPRGKIYTDNGVYATDSGITTLYDRSVIVTKDNQRMTADTIIYNRTTGIGHGYGDMILTDSAKQAELRGDYGFYNELIDSAFVTGHATLMEYSEGDTLYAHGRYLEAFRVIDTIRVAEDTIRGIKASERVDTSHVSVLYPRVRFYRTDLQGLCDSMRITQRDSTLRMYISPVVWNENNQIFGRIIEVHLNDSTVDRMRLPDNGFTAQQIEGKYYDQISGKEMIAWLENKQLRRIDISGNVEILMFPEEKDSTYNKFVTAQSSYLTAEFDSTRTTKYVKMWPQTTGVATPLFIARSSQLYLPAFKWYEAIRPKDKDDIYVIPEEMDRIITDARAEEQKQKHRR